MANFLTWSGDAPDLAQGVHGCYSGWLEEVYEPAGNWRLGLLLRDVASGGHASREMPVMIPGRRYPVLGLLV